jgi:hypothetical protein
MAEKSLCARRSLLFLAMADEGQDVDVVEQQVGA